MKNVLLAVAAVLVAAVIVLASPAEAQRRRRADPPAPLAELTLEPMPDAPSPYHRVVTVRALAPIEVAADRRLVRFEIQPDPDPTATRRARRAPRPVRCEHPDRVARVSAERIRTLQAGGTWSEWIDLREHCWGRALDALRAGGTITATLAHRARGRGRFAVRSVPTGAATTSDERPELVSTAQRSEPIAAPAEPDPESAARVILSPTDARTGRAFTLRVAVLGRTGTRRAYVRPDRVRFTGVGPEGPFECGITPGGGHAQPDLYQRLTPRSGARLSLDGAQYCGDAIQGAGIYEITPILSLEQSGEEWGLDAITGEITGAPSLLRVRRGLRGGYVEHAVGGAPTAAGTTP